MRYIHGYNSVHPVGAVSVDEPCLKSCFDFKRTRTIAGIKTHYDVSATTYVYGMGYSYVEIREHSIGMDARLWVLSTPVDGKLVEMALVSQVREMRKPKRWVAGLRFIPLIWRAKIMNQIIVTAQKRDVLQDVTIWGRKQYRPRPRLCQSDGEIGKYRRYCEQFIQNSRTTAKNGQDSRPVQSEEEAPDQTPCLRLAKRTPLRTLTTHRVRQPQ